MKNILLLFAFTFLIGNGALAQGDGIRFVEGTWQEILAKAAEEDKLIFLDAYAEWCGPCKMMDRNSYPQKAVGDVFNANFVNVKVDMEKGEGRELARRYEVRAYPTLLFLDSDGEVVHRSIGYQSAEELVELGEAATDPSQQLATMDARYKAGDRDSEFLYNYTKARYEVMDGSHKKVAEEYLATQSDWLTPGNMEFIYVFSEGLDSKLFQYIMEHRSEFAQLVGEERLANKIQQTIYQEIYTPGNALSLDEVQAIYNKAYKNEPEIADELFAAFKVEYYQMAGDTDAFAQATIDYFEKFEADNPTQLNNRAWAFYEQVENKKQLKKALDWAERSVELDQQYYNTDTLAALYFKVGKKRKALKTAREAIDLAQTSGEDYSGTMELIRMIQRK